MKFVTCSIPKNLALASILAASILTSCSQEEERYSPEESLDQNLENDSDVEGSIKEPEDLRIDYTADEAYESPAVEDVAENILCLYEGKDFSGNKKCYKDGTIQPWIGKDSNSLNDAISSLKVSKGWALVLYEHKDLSGNKKTFYEDVANLSDEGFNDKTTSFSLYKKVGSANKEKAKDSKVCFYKDKDHKGGKLCFNYPMDIADIGKDKAGWNDEISSVKVEGEFKLKIYTDQHFNGDDKTIKKI